MSHLSRRNLMKTGAAFTIVAPEQVSGTQANSKVSVGLIGAGNRGSFDADIVHKDPRGRITAVCDKYDDKIEAAMQRWGVARGETYKDFEQLLSKSSVDAVLIATPPFEHPRMLEAAVDARKHIYCEKPAGVDVEGCKRFIAASKRHDPKKTLSVGYQQRYGVVYLEAYKRIQNGEIGPLSAARAWWISSDPFQRKPYSDPQEEKIRNWFCYRELSGDIIVEQDCHNFDVLHWFLGGLPLRAVGMGGRKLRTSMDLLDHLSLSYEFPDGVYVAFEANQLTPPGYNRVGEEFTGTKGTIWTSRPTMTHYKYINGNAVNETMTSRRDITIDAFEAWLNRILSGNVENVGERSALSTQIAILGRTAVYTNKEQTWKGLYGA